VEAALEVVALGAAPEVVVLGAARVVAALGAAQAEERVEERAEARRWVAPAVPAPEPV